ncbi:type II and III secretion system protein family protein [Sphingomonas aracearum]|uniref:Type II and III secretion system protein family protein n=2 Tax=Sphingomonas aracearum TaxID=2283317 RepID=A0A369VYL3_9SPHN|nr:type II and III secretion system protein family protein [Sphingomonas aracearum]
MTHLTTRAIAAVAAAALALPPVAAVAAPGKPAPRGNAGWKPARAGLPPVGAQRPTAEKWLSIGEGELVTLPANVADVWVSNQAAADVYVTNPRQINLYGKAFGDSTVFATNAAGAVIYSVVVHVAQNSTSLDRMLKAAMPDAQISVTQVGQIAVLNGTVGSPEDSVQAERLVTTLLNPGVDISTAGAQLKIAAVNRLRAATPLQVNLQVKIAEVSRSFSKNINGNLVSRDTTGGFNFGVSSGRAAGTIGSVSTAGLPQLDASARFGLPAGSIALPFDPKIGDFVLPNSGSSYNFADLGKGGQRTAIGLAGKLAGLDLLAAIDLGETVGLVNTLAQPNMTVISGETGSFLAGGEIPIPVSQGLGAQSVEYKQYGVSLAYTPTVLSDGRISLRVRPEVSQLTSQGAVSIGGVTIPALSTRRVETTVELGSGQSFVIGGLLQNAHNSNLTKTPGVGDLPVLGALFRSNSWQRDETELVVVITPYLVKPVNATEIALPTDGYKSPTDLSRVLFGQVDAGKTGGQRPKPSMAAPPEAQPAFGAAAPVPTAPAPVQPLQQEPREDKAATTKKSKKSAGVAMPGFSN